MKKLILLLISLLLVISCTVGLAACNGGLNNETSDTSSEITTNIPSDSTGSESESEAVTVEAKGVWANATYLADTTLGSGTAKSVSFDIEAEGQKITITLKTDKNTLGEAMYEHGLIHDPTFFDTLNGIKADWNKDQAYWAYYQGDEYMMVGVNDTNISDGDHYRFVYTK